MDVFYFNRRLYNSIKPDLRPRVTASVRLEA
jgi:hypothetical protein